MIPFNIPAITGKETDYIKEAIALNHLSGDGIFTKKCSDWFESRLHVKRALMTTSCTHSLEMCAILADIGDGDEVIMPSFTFVSTANAFVLRGAKVVFVDIDPLTMNMDLKEVVRAITSKTKAIIPVHYAGNSCDMDKLMNIAEHYNLLVIEDAAQAIMSEYHNKPLGTIGHLGCISFHETKNLNCGEGGALLINDSRFIDRAEIIREKGTNRSKFYRGEVDKYSWVDIGSSYLMSELNAAFLYAQLINAETITYNRINNWNLYHELFHEYSLNDYIELPMIPTYNKPNGHMYYIKTTHLVERTELIQYLRANGVYSVFHYVPLHSSPLGRKYGFFSGEDQYTTRESERILRLPLFYGMSANDVKYISEMVNRYYKFVRSTS
ncbi:dTDP-4-amino-4,6-dideoxygalactose transaminase [Cohnella sp. CFH 77786]|uniref:dTDP-4-amino-4,6-dideoxygalactose transaminase n=1 Tax=Cohnella sp. CFH 77786 TaxID=2662265 RepID=UPI001C60E32D|nr:dTDP-4-amino-4,6-dideoxygalactose transaminase [Cohnella sp. CFH 77786]MBW5448458.1 dTDP-4-amino-4,6-dideoxygalactose transaminase [Cohnella sp. CFH 77786]